MLRVYRLKNWYALGVTLETFNFAFRLRKIPCSEAEATSVAASGHLVATLTDPIEPWALPAYPGRPCPRPRAAGLDRGAPPGVTCDEAEARHHVGRRIVT